MKDKRIVIAGGTGLLGAACRSFLEKKGWTVQILTRSNRNEVGFIQWDPANKSIESNVTDGAHAVINLTGQPLDAERWTPQYKRALHDSRVLPARFLGELIESAGTPPKVYVGAAAVGIYGDSGSEPVREDDVATDRDKFVIRLAHDWEDAHPVLEGMRRVIFRIAVVLSRDGGFLPRVSEPARLGAYGYFGNGKQYMSWIHIEDLARAVTWAVEQPLDGIYNASADAAPSKTVMRVLKDVRGGFGILAGLPYPLARIAFGEMAELLMYSCNASPRKLLDSGFEFKFGKLKEALKDQV